MEGKGRTACHILTFLSILTINACTGNSLDNVGTLENTVIILKYPEYETKALFPNENCINDVNIVIFENGKIEEIIWKTGIHGPDGLKFEVTLVKGRRYTISALANIGRRLYKEDYDRWEDMTVELNDSNGFRYDIPMSATINDFIAGHNDEITMEFIHLAAKISLQIDRSRLSDDVRIKVREVNVGNYPRAVSVKGPSKAESGKDVFSTGFKLNPDQCSPLNDYGNDGLSSNVSVYMLENMQGDFPYAIGEDEEKVLEKDDPLSERASYIEIKMDYQSSGLVSYDSPLVYRFYLGDGLKNLDIERNCHYHITVIPEDDGLSGSGWRVDKSGIGPSTPVFTMHPGDYVEGHVGDSLRVWCDCYPRTAPFSPGLEELDYDRNRGIYDYRLDDDMHGVTLYLKKPGTGIVYMSAGDPINRDGMVIVRVVP